VAGLAAEQFEVSVDGKPRRVASATFLDYAAAQADRPATAAGQAGARLVEGSYGSNEVPEAEVDAGTPGRVVVLAIDQLSFPPGAGRAAMESAKRYLDRLQPSDRVGLAAYPSPGPSVAPTVDHAVVRGALDRVLGMAETMQGVRPYLTPSEAMAIDRGDAMARQQVLDRECGSERGASEPGMYSAVYAFIRRVDAAAPQMVTQLEAQRPRAPVGR